MEDGALPTGLCLQRAEDSPDVGIVIFMKHHLSQSSVIIVSITILLVNRELNSL